jgi:two-component system, chemotaxis family, chemotaxis protein CheY
MKSLIVDDEAFCRDFVGTLLQPTGECHYASNGHEAIGKYEQALQEGAPHDLIILDIMMPGLSGHDTAKEIRALEKRQNVKPVKIVMLTGLNSASDAMESFWSAQSAAYLVKPVSKDELMKVLSKLGLLKR